MSTARTIYTAKAQDTYVRPRMRWWDYAAVLPIILGIMTTYLWLNFDGYYIVGASMIMVLVVYLKQLKALFKVEQYRNYVRYHIVFLIAGFALVTASSFAGDLAGWNHFNNGSLQPFSDIGIPLYTSAWALEILAIATLIRFTSFGYKTAVRVIGWIIYWILWVVLLIVSYFTYGIMYAAHDPNSE